MRLLGGGARTAGFTAKQPGASSTIGEGAQEGGYGKREIMGAGYEKWELKGCSNGARALTTSLALSHLPWLRRCCVPNPSHVTSVKLNVRQSIASCECCVYAIVYVLRSSRQAAL